MHQNNSPWIKELARTRNSIPVNKNLHADVAIVGGGIAGVVTAYYTLTQTDKSVILLEADKIAHGATGHNAGQITSYFERPLPDIAKEFGVDLAVDGQRKVEDAWELLTKIISDTAIDVRHYSFTGYAGVSTLEQLIPHLESSRLRVDHKLFQETILVAREWVGKNKIPEKFKDLYSIVDQARILSQLESNNKEYIASLSYKKGCMNSAVFTEKLVQYLVKKFPRRFSFYEQSPMKVLNLYKIDAVLEVNKFRIRVKRVVLCTNGFEHFKINNEAGAQVNTQFHHSIEGLVGYMSAYVQTSKHDPIAISYFPKESINKDTVLNDSYFYITRRPFEHEVNKVHNLISIGGPDKALPESEKFIFDHEQVDTVNDTIDTFLRSSYNKYPVEDVEFVYSWQGLMGYTPNGIRRIGPEPCNEVLLYNLGCNGVGILPSIFGGKRIAQYLNNEKVEPSIFDPQDQRM